MWKVIIASRDGCYHEVLFDGVPDQHAIVECLLYMWSGGKVTGYAK